jgi:SAM-dependent methyltransferase
MLTMSDTAVAHYDRLLAEHYTWMVGDYEAAVDAQRELLAQLGVTRAPAGPAGGSRPHHALDLGAGPGYQTMALANLGYRVTAVDTSARLLAELVARRGLLPVSAVMGDIRDVRALDAVRQVCTEAGGYDIAICMGDTLLHLETAAEVERLFGDVHATLAPGGVLAVTFRDLTGELVGLDRFISVQSDADRVMTCFLEYERERADTVVVHDLVHVRDGAGWLLKKSSYRKLRLAPAWVAERLGAVGFAVTHRGVAGRLVAMTATKASP